MKLIVRRIINLLLWLNVCFLGGTGALLYWRLPPGSRGGHGLSLWGLTRHEWGDFHAIAGLIFAALIFTHLYLAWAWLKNAAAGKRLWPILAGLAIGLAIPATFILTPVQQSSPSEQTSSDDNRPQQHRWGNPLE
ncbi:DUF4405 domain-containing protein [Cerasicoccus arenae]|uniref:Flavinylation-associated cytochrome domain-containing protein n=1 Tax=Cerasicoccus arenae TaxID=424488 RepID=A0A8J3DJK7_9BACT|nr:DUF4405 domain-containing protein [Cerasicoccus arenae]MBK1859828.1 DUF4405 domain-containing protein [Cerasicoccus arenae]GHC08407.1 hypothetical protein GCM10007047_27100 [Cerasicoccus arenae]